MTLEELCSSSKYKEKNMTKAKLITKMLGLMLLPTCLYASEVEVYGVIDTGIAVSEWTGKPGFTKKQVL